MIPASSTAPVIAAAAAAARRRLLRAFRAADATTPERAIPYAPSRRMERRYVASLVDYGALVETAAGVYYLDESKLRAHSARRRKRALGIIGAAAAVGTAIVGLTQV